MGSPGQRDDGSGPVIPRREVDDLQAAWQLSHAVIEKDYVLGWLLAGIASHPSLSEWVFKGGTCLRKCYFETYRFSEDLDFTVAGGAVLSVAFLQQTFSDVAAWVLERSGLQLTVGDSSFRERRNKRGNPTFEGRIAFRGPLEQPGTPKVKLDITADELLTDRPAVRSVLHPYSDAMGDEGAIGTIACYSLVELMAEKLRALAERCRPRDLYDIVHTHRHPELLGQASDVSRALAEKARFVGIEPPTLASTRATPFRSEIEQEWANMLGHQLPELPPFDHFWDELDEVFAWLDGSVAVPILPRAELASVAVTPWTPPRSMVTWRTGAPLELIRFAGANRLLVNLDYMPLEGRSGPRQVEPYALRRSKAGDLLLFVVNDRGQLRSYRVDRIVGASVTRESFQPRHLVEF